MSEPHVVADRKAEYTNAGSIPPGVVDAASTGRDAGRPLLERRGPLSWGHRRAPGDRNAIGVAVTLSGGRLLGNKTLLDAAVTLALSGAMLVGVLVAQAMRAKPPAIVAETLESPLTPAEPTESPLETAVEETATQLFPELSKAPPRANVLPSLMELEARSRQWLRSLGVLGIIRIVAAIAGVVATVIVLKYRAFTLDADTADGWRHGGGVPHRGGHGGRRGEDIYRSSIRPASPSRLDSPARLE